MEQVECVHAMPSEWCAICNGKDKQEQESEYESDFLDRA